MKKSSSIRKTFTEAYEFVYGKKWEWRNEDGTTNSPQDSNDIEIRAFHKGYMLAKKEVKFYKDKLNELEYVKKRISELEKSIREV